ncbi:MAG: YggT family protein [Candidatus Latescibacteria bacterium]|nr:YggT family protein [Candidatus Latescibacterota bacterium]
MFDYGGFLYGVIRIVDNLLWVYMWVIIIRALISWVHPDPYNPIVRFLDSVTDPLLSFIRRLSPRLLWSTGIDFSPLIAIVMIQVIRLVLGSIRVGQRFMP